MTRNYVALFISTILVFSALAEGMFGTKGFIVNSHLRQTVESRQREHDELVLRLRDLEHRLQTVWDENELLDDARILGYVQRGESVYFFEDDEGNLSVNIPDAPQTGESAVAGSKGAFPGFSRWVNLGIGCAGTLNCSLLLHLLRKRKRIIVTMRR